MSFLDNLYWRFATKKFDPNKPVKAEDLTNVLEAIKLAPTSLGLQPFHVYVVGDQAVKEKMRPGSFDQAQVTEAKYVLVFCADIDITPKIESYLKVLSDSGGDPGVTAGRKARFKMFLDNKNTEELLLWASKSTYIALGFGLAACAELNLDSCPMEGFEPDKIAEVLDLPVNQRPLVYLAIGYRAEGPTYGKVRLKDSDLFTFV